jgi:hypothetical protein
MGLACTMEKGRVWHKLDTWSEDEAKSWDAKKFGVMNWTLVPSIWGR